MVALGSPVTYQCISLRSYHGTVAKVAGNRVWVRWGNSLHESEEWMPNLAITDDRWDPLPGQVPEWNPKERVA